MREKLTKEYVEYDNGYKEELSAGDALRMEFYLKTKEPISAQDKHAIYNLTSGKQYPVSHNWREQIEEKMETPEFRKNAKVTMIGYYILALLLSLVFVTLCAGVIAVPAWIAVILCIALAILAIKYFSFASGIFIIVFSNIKEML